MDKRKDYRMDVRDIYVVLIHFSWFAIEWVTNPEM